MSVAAGVSDSAIAVRDKLRGKIGQTKVKRYWPGRAPEWAEGIEEEPEFRGSRSVNILREELARAFPKEDHDFPVKDDPRLRRLAERVRDRDEVIASHRQIRQAELVSTKEEDARAAEAAALVEDEGEEAVEERRRKIKERLLQRRREEEAAIEEEEEEEEGDDDDESEFETDSEEEFGGIAMVKPVFVPKAERETIAEREKLAAEEAAFQEAMKKKLEERKVETKHLLVEEIRKEEEADKNRQAEEGEGADVDTDDETNEAEEYEAWKAREIARIKRDREDREAMVKEKEEIEKLRNMTEEERREWERKNPKAPVPSKKKWKFMQKYYHKGAFFQSAADDRISSVSSENIFRRDFSAPTGEDKMDKTILPKVMQVKHFGRSGRTKWTHLVAEDTTEWENPWTINDPLRAKYNSKMAGMNRPITKPAGSKKLKDWEEER